MKAVLEFELPVDDSEFECASKSMELAIFQWDLKQWIRDKLNHAELKPNQAELLEELRDWTIENEVNLEKWQ